MREGQEISIGEVRLRFTLADAGTDQLPVLSPADDAHLIQAPPESPGEGLLDEEEAPETTTFQPDERRCCSVS